MGAVLHAVSVPPSGGDTLFCDMAAVYDGLDDDLRARIDGLVAVHDYAQVVRPPARPTDAKAEMRAKYPPVEHPVVRTHPETGRKLLFVNRFFTSHIVDSTPDASSALIDQLCREANYPEYQCRFRWEPDSVAFWDNRAVQHYAVERLLARRPRRRTRQHHRRPAPLRKTVSGLFGIGLVRVVEQ